MKLSSLLLRICILLILDSISAEIRQKRSIKALTGLFAPATPSPLANYPIWKVHKYTGIDLRPVRPEEYHHPHDVDEITEFNHEPRENLGEPPSLVEVPDVGGNTETIHHVGELLEDIDESKETQDSVGPVASWLAGHPGSTSALLGYLGLDRSDQEAEDRLLKPHPSIVKKKVISLAALAALLKKAAIAKVPIKTAAVGVQKVVGSVVHKATTPAIFYPTRSAIYREIPHKYPKGPSLLGKLPIIGTHFAPSGTPVKLVEPILPKIPALKLVPEAPKLPHLYLPGPYKVPYSTGSYVSIRVPTPHQVHSIDAPSHGPPATSYGVPDQEYGPPNDQLIQAVPSPAPESQLAPDYGFPAYQLSQLPLQYSTSAGQYQQFQPSGAPVYQQVHQYSAPVSQSSQQYGAPLSQSSQQYSAPAPEYQLPQQYNAPATEYQPEQQYSAPVSQLSQKYGAPVSQSSQQYSAPAPEYQLPQQYNSAPATEYQPAQQYSAPPIQQYSPATDQTNDSVNYNNYPAAQKKLFDENESILSSQQEKIESTADVEKSENK